MEVFDSKRNRIPLGRRLGSGGEGDVYEAPINGAALVAKIYHNPVNPEKQEKLMGMFRTSNDRLHGISAWPLDTLHNINGSVIGFLMQKMTGYRAIHELYGPAHRKQEFPNADWAFLIQAARNVAAAFSTMHSYSYVIGDVNQGNIFVAQNATIKLIDCDSFQIPINGRCHLCEGGVGHFTPPELQGVRFRDVIRTENHDNFGLAVICFHLLFMGQHPFAGRYQGQGEMPIERAISEFRFAFGINANYRKMEPPPNSLPFTSVSQHVVLLFERAFSEHGSLHNCRPRAIEWVYVLDELRNQLRTCGYNPAHKYINGLPRCPWCDLDPDFFPHPDPDPPKQSILTELWERILGISSPGEALPINLWSFVVVPKPLPQEVIKARSGIFKSIKSFFFGESEVLSRERKKRQNAFDEAQNIWEYAKKKWEKEAGEISFKTKIQELEKLRSEYERLLSEYTIEKKKLYDNRRVLALENFLGTFFIDNETIPNIGPGRKAMLASFGIETAADIELNRIIAIRGFGFALTNTLIAWRNRKERQFIFNPAKDIDPADMARLNQKYRPSKIRIERALLSGPEQLAQIKSEILRKRQTLHPEVSNATKTFAQAKADLSLL